MGWDQTMQRQSVMDFLLDLMEIDPNQLLLEALQAKLAEKGLTYESAPAEGREEGDGMYNSFIPDVVTLSDGRVFIETQTETTQGDDWGNDYYSFVEAGKTFTFTRNDYHYDGNDPHVSKEEMISTYNLPGPDMRKGHDIVAKAAEDISFGDKGKSFTPDEIREQGGEFGDSIADFMTDQGIDHISFEPGDEE